MSCARRFEAEASRDGRLGASERASFEAHADACPTCAEEIESLDALARVLRDDVDGGEGPTDELHVRRERTRLLAAFDRELVTTGPRRGPKPTLRFVAIAATAFVMLAAFFGWRSRKAMPNAPSARSVAVEANGAVWSKATDSDRERITLVQGELRIRVSHEGGARSIVVTLPDGELEDIGTTFSVSAEAGRTTHVRVEEGSVALRLHGRESITIRAGGEWNAVAPVAPSAASPAASASAMSSAISEPRAAFRAPAASASSAPAREAEAPGAFDASAEFRGAMAALDSGDHARAASAFATFVATHPSDARAEDAAYLRVLALSRANDAVATNEAAADYLRRYPNGFRRAEVQHLAR